jgi:putative acyl-CoA dehydrogenase
MRCSSSWATAMATAPGGAHRQLKGAFADTGDIQYRARQLTEDIAVALQAKLLLEAGNAAVSDAFIASRLGGGGRVYGACRAGGCRGAGRRATPVWGG